MHSPGSRFVYRAEDMSRDAAALYAVLATTAVLLLLPPTAVPRKKEPTLLTAVCKNSEFYYDLHFSPLAQVPRSVPAPLSTAVSTTTFSFTIVLYYNYYMNVDDIINYRYTTHLSRLRPSTYPSHAKYAAVVVTAVQR